MVFTTPIIRAVRRRYPQAHVVYLVEPAAAPVVAGNPHIDELIVAPKAAGLARIREDIALARDLRRRRFDIAIDLHGGSRSAWLTWATRAPTRIGYNIRGRAWMYTHVVSRSPDLTPRHSVENQWDLLAPLGVEPPDPARDPVEMPEDAGAAARVAERLCAMGIGAGTPFAVIHVSAGNPFRRWPPAAFADLAVALVRRHPGMHVILTSGPSDWDAAGAIAAAARAKVDVSDTIHQDDSSLAELRALTARAAVYIGGDSGPLHIASTTAAPIVALLGPTLPERSRPWRDPRWRAEVVDAGPLPCRPCHQRHCVPGDYRCLTRITPEQVCDAAERVMKLDRV